ncbi:MAG: hypothetical protein M1324_02050 [Patescibacteria group bacterium]|nr:hypothetical protein [Patescibacteria group bacterium]
MGKMLASGLEVVAWVKPTNPLSLRLVRLFLAGRCFDYYDGARKANCHIGEMLCQFGMVRAEGAQLTISCFVLKEKIKKPIDRFVTDAIPISRGKLSLSIDIRMNGTRVRLLWVTAKPKSGIDPIYPLSRKILPKLVWAMLFCPRFYWEGWRLRRY